MRYLMVVLLFVVSCATVKPEIVFELPPQEIIHTLAVEINGVKGQFEFCDDGELWDTTNQIFIHYSDKYPSIWMTNFYRSEGKKLFIGLTRFHADDSRQAFDEYGKYDPQIQASPLVRVISGKFDIQWIELEFVKGGFKIGDLRGKWLD